MDIEEFNVKVDALFEQAVRGEFTSEDLKHALRFLCGMFEDDLIFLCED